MGVVRRFAGGTGFHRSDGKAGPLRWDGVAVEPYAPDVPSGTRQVLIGPAESAPNFAVRYFEVPPGRPATLDSHAHDHGVVVLQGRGRVRLGDEEHAIGFGDVIYVSPHEPHAFEAQGPEPLGFLCVVPARR